MEQVSHPLLLKRSPVDLSQSVGRIDRRLDWRNMVKVTEVVRHIWIVSGEITTGDKGHHNMVGFREITAVFSEGSKKKTLPTKENKFFR